MAGEVSLAEAAAGAAVLGNVIAVDQGGGTGTGILAWRERGGGGGEAQKEKERHAIMHTILMNTNVVIIILTIMIKYI